MTSQPATVPTTQRPLTAPPRRHRGWSPKARRTRAAGLAVLLISAVGAAIILPGFKNERKDLITHTVRRETLELTVVEGGALESANNRDIVCRVKAGNKSTATTIKWV